MKNETQIAEKKIRSYKEVEATSFKLVRLASCKSHKASCERFLVFLEEGQKGKRISTFSHKVDLKITDLKNAIKKYDEVGI